MSKIPRYEVMDANPADWAETLAQCEGGSWVRYEDIVFLVEDFMRMRVLVGAMADVLEKHGLDLVAKDLRGIIGKGEATDDDQ